MTNITNATATSLKKLQWHQAFYADIQIEFENYADKLIFENGIYYVKGDILSIQFIVTKDLTDEQNLWLHNLTNDIKESKRKL